MDRILRSLVAAGVLALAALPGGMDARAEPEPRADEIEVFRGGERSVVRPTLRDRSLREERGVLATRGVAAGAPGAAAPGSLASLGGPARERLRADLEAIGRVYAEVLELQAAPELAETLGALEPGEPLRAPHRHAPAATLAERTRHEASHAWLQALAPGAPAWLDEGLACYFESLERGPAGEIRVRGNALRHGVVRSAARRGELPGLAELRKLPRSELSLEPAAAASWALAFSLMQSSETRDVVRALLRGEAPADLAAELSALGADTPSELPRRWRRTASGALAAQLLVPAPAPTPVLEAESAGEEAQDPDLEPLYRREVRCVRGILGAGTPEARPALFCSRRRVRIGPDQD